MALETEGSNPSVHPYQTISNFRGAARGSSSVYRRQLSVVSLDVDEPRWNPARVREFRRCHEVPTASGTAGTYGDALAALEVLINAGV